ncbi:hypothetical protein MAFF241647_46980 (plasmid) [Ralstonia solanacearum]|nr:hypothetical protein MAFF241647_46980 [Ralstonia solanacearum]
MAGIPHPTPPVAGCRRFCNVSGDAGLSSPPAPAQTLSHAPFAYPAFRLFWLARLSTTFAYQMFGVAVGWQIYDLTRSAYVLGLVGLAQFLPSVVLVLASGHIADRYDRRRVVRICQAIEALVAAMLAAATLTGHASIQPIFVFVVVIGAMRAFETPTLQALLPSLVPPAALPRARWHCPARPGRPASSWDRPWAASCMWRARRWSMPRQPACSCWRMCWWPACAPGGRRPSASR